MTRPNPDVRNQRGASSPAPSSPAQQHPSRPSPFQVTLTHDLLESYVYVDVTEAISTTSALRRDVTWLKRFRERYLNPLYRALVRASAVSVACAPIALTIPVTQMLLEMDYEDFCREVVVVMIGTLNQEVKLARIQHRCVHRKEQGAEQLVQQLTVALLVSGYADYASKVMDAFIKECSRVHWVERQELELAAFREGEIGFSRHTSRTIASYIAPAVITAVDYGVADQVARVQKRMVDDGHFDVVTELVTYIAEDAGRPDIVAMGTLELLRRYGEHGIRLAAAISAKSFAETHRRHHDARDPDSVVRAIAAVASIMFLRSSGEQRSRAAKTIAMAATRGCTLHANPLSVVKVSYYMKANGGGHAVSMAMNYMRDAQAISGILVTSMRWGYVWLVVWLFADMLLSGYVGSMIYSARALGTWWLAERTSCLSHELEGPRLRERGNEGTRE